MSTDEPPDWERYFGFERPYENQADAIEAAIETVRAEGYLAMEGPCGTGKTMAALTAAASLLRETDRFENVVVATPVKQQRQQFVEDLRTINRGLDEPLSGVGLVGKADLCPYGREDSFPPDTSVQSRCEELRETTADLVRAEESGSQRVDTAGGSTAPDSATPASPDLDGEAGPEPAVVIEGTDDAADQWWDADRARELADTARRDLSGGDDDPLETAGVSAPYGTAQPAAPAAFTDDESTPLYCPFEADWYAREAGSPVGFEAGTDHVLSTREFLPAAVEAGTCPHRVMSVLLENADVVVGNYNHLFDSRTRHLTESILDERTLVIVDEAHRLEERVRDLLSDTVGRVTLKQARRDLGTLLERARQHPDNRERIESGLADHDVPYEALERAYRFYGEAIEWLDRRVETALDERFDGYGTGFVTEVLPDERVELELRDPEVDEPDAFTAWAEGAGYTGNFFRTLGAVGAAVEDVCSQQGIDRDCVCTATGVLFARWWSRDHTAFFREITLEPSDSEYRDPDYPWQTVYNASLVMYNCIPSEQVREILGEFGGGILMSATLEPIPIFEAVSGLESLSTRSPDDEGATRRVDRRSYDLQFPVSNRESWIVDVMPFTARNRGPPTADNHNETRERYAYAAREIARSHGNVLLAYPNYAEAEWAAGRLRESVDKPVVLDRSSSHEETQRLKSQFFGDDHSVLVTSTRGTLTEGVDYDGEKLHTCAVFGVPLVNIGSPRVQAVKHAYGDRFGADNAFPYALTVPAVRQVRQAIGRVLRGPDERGVRILVGERYLPDRPRSVRPFLSAQERREFDRLTPEFLADQLAAFWDGGE
ncbi:ATP-dependent DNA helicase [Halohasta salina]|uniref:ATP-dependent DNA helicase n=1 Tax=Halohasta salina TaxID=2961621 RepID=UPI003CCD6921